MQKYLKYTFVPLAKITATIFHFMKHCQPTCFSKKCIHNALNKDQGESIHKFLFVFAIRCSCSVREYNTYIELGHENKRTKPETGYPQTSRNILGLITKELINLGSQFNKNILRNFKPQFPRVITIRKSTIEYWYKTTNYHCKEIKKYRHWFVRLGKFKKKEYRTGSLMSEWRWNS